MTSPSRRKPRITPPNMRRWIRSDRIFLAGLLIGLVLIARPAMAAEPPRGENGFERTPPRDALSPLDRLRARSSAQRWKQLSDELRGTSRVGAEIETTDPPPAGVESDTPEARTLEDPQGVELPAEEPLPVQRRRVAAAQQPPQPVPDRRYAEPARNPRDLRKVTEILPFFDYEPDPNVAKDDPCLYRCPRPAGPPCKQYPPGQEPACPEEIELSKEQYAGRAAPETMVNWEASNLYHNPLYFQDAPLERYGHTHCCLVQPFASVGKFSLQLLGLPYQATIDPGCKHMYALGWYRPGECAPKKCYQIPWNWDAAMVEAGAATGMVFFLP